MDRRRFVQSVGTVGALSLGVEACQKTSVNAPKQSASETNTFSWKPETDDAPLSLPTGMARTALVIGGGLAGLSAALELAERGYKVTVREMMPYLGGKLATRKIATSAGEFSVEHGLHMWFHNYVNFKDIRERIGINAHFRTYKSVSFVFRDYKPETIVSHPPVYPLNLMNILRTSPNLNILDAIGTLGGIKDVLLFDYDKLYERFDGISFRDWADKNQVNKKFFDIIMEPASSVTLNDPKNISAAEMILYMFYFFIGHPRAFNREITTTDHATAVINPWAQHLRDLGVTFELDRTTAGLRFEKGRAIGEVNSSEVYDHVILATNVGSSKAILSNSQGADEPSKRALRTVQERIALLKVAPPYKILRAWFDRPLDPSRPDVLETPQHRPINLLAQFHQLEHESRVWAEKTKGSVIEFHLYTTPELKDLGPDDVWPAIRNTVFEVLPELKNAHVMATTVGSYENFTSFEVGQGRIRPTADFAVRSGLTNLGLAGDWVHTLYPSALMERAVSTGREAANLCLSADGVRKAPVFKTSAKGPGLIQA